MKISGELYGLAVCGGESKRMGIDKSSLTYFEKPQRYHVCEMLGSGIENICNKAFISCNRAQSDTILKEYEMIQDLPEFENMGPMAAILTAFAHYPDHDFLVVGCDYPFITGEVLRGFLKQKKGTSIAAAFYNQDNKYEPLLAWYSKEAGLVLNKQLENKQYSLQQFLIDCKAEKYIPTDHIVMTSVDTPEQFNDAKALLIK